MHPCKAQEDAGAEVAAPIMILAVFSECTFHSRENESGRSRELRFGFTQSLIMSFIASCHVGGERNSVASELPVQCIYLREHVGHVRVEDSVLFQMIKVFCRNIKKMSNSLWSTKSRFP